MKISREEYQEILDLRDEELEKPWHQRQMERDEAMADDDRDAMLEGS